MRTAWAYPSDASERIPSTISNSSVLSHNTVRGAAGGALLCAETLKAKGYIQAK